MCTLVIAWQVLADAPIAAAANRDERLDRPASPPSPIEGNPTIVAPRDEAAGGTWLGYNDAGLLVGLSNRWVDGDLAGERSRGLLVLDLLGARSADEAASMVDNALDTHTYEPFNLVIADTSTALVFEWDGALRVTDLDPGVHAVLNAGWDDRFVASEGRENVVAEQAESAHRLREVLAVGEGERAAAWLDRAADVLGDHEYGVCVHGDGYGTRSSSLIALNADGTASYRFAGGPPCETAYADIETQTQS